MSQATVTTLRVLGVGRLVMFLLTTEQTTRVPTDTHTPETGQNSGEYTSTNSASASTSASAATSASISVSQQPSAGPSQSVHSTLLAPLHKLSFKAKVSGKTEDPPESGAIKSGRTQLYHNWWQQDPSNICLFGVHLIGDAEAPSQCASMALTDLAFCRLGLNYISLLHK